MKQYGLWFHIGDKPLPYELPSDWEVTMSHHHATIAEHKPTRKRFLLGKDKMYPWKLCPMEGLPLSILKPGQAYIDTLNPIEPPTEIASGPTVNDPKGSLRW